MKGHNTAPGLREGKPKSAGKAAWGSIAKSTWLGSAKAVKSLYLAGHVGRESKAISISVGGAGSYYGKKLWSGKLE